MQPLGILMLTCGTWLVYSGVVGIPPLETIQKIIVSPNNASKIIATAKAESDLSVSVIASAVVARNPFSNLEVSDDFQEHKDRGSQSPGVDFVAPVGTPIIAPVSGRVTNNPSGGAAGYFVEVVDAAGYRHQFMHLSRFRPEINGAEIKAGSVIGYSGGKKGATGAGSSTGPHIHYNIITPSGNFIDPLTYLNRRSEGKVKAE